MRFGSLQTVRQGVSVVAKFARQSGIVLDEHMMRDIVWGDALLTSSAVGPVPIRPEEIVSAMRRGQIGPDDDGDMLATIHTLNALQQQQILERLERLGPKYVPAHFDEADEDALMARVDCWVHGFVTGIKMRAKAWKPMLTDELGNAILQPVLTFVQLQCGKSLVGDLLPGEIVEVRREALPCLGEAVFKTYVWWQQHADDAARHGGRLGKVGRNESCPCGSGQKYKRCCLN